MYENQTFDAILKRMLDRVPNDVDKREGSVIYDALAPAAAELAQMYAELDIILNLSFADTATGEWLARRTAEFGIERRPATKARRKGLFYGAGNAPLDVPIASRFSIGGLNYRVVERLAAGQFSLECETAGTVGNQQFGPMLPIDYIAGLSRAELADVLVPGEDEESDEDIRKRYFEAVREQPFGGNVADYKRKVGEIPGVGGVKVFPTWQGGGTVKCTIIAADYNPPASALIDEVQTAIDPEQNGGEGLGLAPIGHIVTIAGVQGVTVNVTTTVTLQSGVTLGQVQGEIETVIRDYLLSLRQTWVEEDRLIVRVSQIEARILAVAGITDVMGTNLNGAAANIELQSEEIPLLGTVTINAS